jgi:hypothetical protein
MEQKIRKTIEFSTHQTNDRWGSRFSVLRIDTIGWSHSTFDSFTGGHGFVLYSEHGDEGADELIQVFESAIIAAAAQIVARRSAPVVVDAGAGNDI